MGKWCMFLWAELQVFYYKHLDKKNGKENANSLINSSTARPNGKIDRFWIFYNYIGIRTKQHIKLFPNIGNLH